MVLQVRVPGELDLSGAYTKQFIPYHVSLSLVPHWLSVTGFTASPGRHLSKLYPY